MDFKNAFDIFSDPRLLGYIGLAVVIVLIASVVLAAIGTRNPHLRRR